MKINSELPMCMLSHNNDINEYDFVLFHLYISNEGYKQYYINQRIKNPDRLMILDNSAYEFYIKNACIDINEYYQVIKELQPDYYILPDVLMDYSSTIELVREFLQMFDDALKIGVSQPMAVAQGNSRSELIHCLSTYRDMGIKSVAIPFHNSFFKQEGYIVDSDVAAEFINRRGMLISDDTLYAMGRVQFIRDIKNILKEFIHVHILGSHDPIEKVFYEHYDTMDTGYPVKLAVVGELLFEEKQKPNVIIDDFMDDDLDIETIELITININKFKQL